MAINKIVYGADTLVDLTEDTVTAEDVLNSKSFHTSDGVKRTGTASYPVTDVQVNGTSVMDGTVAKVEQPTAEVKSATDTFTTVNGGLLEECVIDLVPVQDLHGYDSPWVGGAGKNKLPMVLADIKALNTSGTWSGNAYTLNDVTLTINTDNDGNVIGIKANGTASADVTLIIFGSSTSSSADIVFSSSFIASTEVVGSASTVRGVVWAQSGAYVDSAEVTFNAMTVYGFGIRVANGYSIPSGGVTFKPMLRLATSESGFEPYSNICPISGHTEVDLQTAGKNLLSGVEDGGVTDYGTTESSTIRCRSIDYIPVKPNTQYTFKALASGGVLQYIIRTFYDNNNTYKESDNGGWHSGAYSFTTSNDVHFVKIIFSYTSHTAISASNIYDAQLELGSTATPYVPYNGYRVTVNLGGTYYSGILDVVTGVFTPDTIEKDMGDITYNYNSAENIFGTELISDMADPIPTKVQLRCSVLNALTPKDIAGIKNANDNSIAFNSVGSVKFMRIKCTSYTDGNALKTAMTGQKIVYELATPTPIQLSPTMVKALVGENHLSVPLEGQEITESKYRELFTWDEVEEIAQKMADSKIDNLNTSYDTTFSSAFTEARYVKKVYEAPALTALYVVLSGATSVTFNHQLIFSDAQTCCELIQFGSGARIGITDVAISQGSVTFTFDSPLTKAIGFRCRITNDFVS